MPDETPPTVKIGRNQSTLVIDAPVGCTAVLAQQVRGLLEADGADRIAHLYFDLSNAPSIDSTFAGLLVSLVRDHRSRNGPAVHLVRPGDQVQEALTRMHLLALFDLCDAVPSPPTQWQVLAETSPDVERLCDVVVDSHRHLIDADERNESKYSGVIDAFETERKRRSGDSANS